MRCLTLADALQARGAQVQFVCRDLDGHLMANLRMRGMDVRALPAPKGGRAHPEPGYSAWLGVPEHTDAEETIAALPKTVPDWLVVDHYALASAWERQVQGSAGRLLVIDDLANRPHDCDVLLDPNYWPTHDHRYGGLVPERCLVLTGAQFALLGPAYANARRIAPERDGVVRRVFVYFGGSDPYDMTSLTLAVLSQSEFADLDVDIVVGPNNAQRDAIRSQASRRARTSLFEPRAHLADLMTRADLAIGAAGVATWERMCLGLPSLVVCIADNQRPTCEALSAEGLIDYAGDWTSVGSEELAGALRHILSRPDHLRSLSLRCSRLIDGLGVPRVMAIMCAPDVTRG